MSFDIIFENTELIVVDKPHGWLSTPARDAADPRPCVGRDVQTRAGQQIFPVHRLDFEVSGLLMFAKTREAHRDGQRWFEESAVRKTYHALSAPGAGDYEQWAEWHSKLARGKKRAFEAAHGKPSLTRARMVAGDSEYWEWELMPMTGRPHQLRFEMAKHFFPIIGDVLYGGKPAPIENWIGLRAVALDFTVIPDAGRFGLPQVLRAPDLRRP